MGCLLYTSLFCNNLGCQPRNRGIEGEILIPALFLGQLPDERLEHLRARVGDRIHGMPQAINQPLAVKHLAPQQLIQIIGHLLVVMGIGNVALEVLEHLHNLIIGAAMLRPFQRAERRRDRRIGIRSRRGDHMRGKMCIRDRNWKAKYEELNDRYLRMAAEYDNFRKRSQREREQAYTDAVSRAVTALLPTYDNLERALKAETADAEYKKGVELTMTQLTDSLKGLNVTVIEASAGTTFDPNFHNAVMHVEDEALGESVIAEVFQQGFQIGDKVIRHAMVKVAN